MIIAKELIDASVNAKNAAEEAKIKSLWESIEGMINRVKDLSSVIGDIMDTFYYVREQDEGIGTQMWHMLCREDTEFDLDFCNAIMDVNGGRCGVRPHYTRKDCYGNIYVTRIGIYFGPDHATLYPIDELKDKLQPKSYESMLKAMCLLIEAVPAYKKRIVSKLSQILQGEKYPKDALGKVQPK